MQPIDQPLGGKSCLQPRSPFDQQSGHLPFEQRLQTGVERLCCNHVRACLFQRRGLAGRLALRTREYYDRPVCKRREQPRPERRPESPVEDHSHQGAQAETFPRRQQRIVHEQGLRPDRNRVDRRTELLCPAVGGRGGDGRPHTRPGRDFPIEARRRLAHHQRPLGPLDGDVGIVESRRVVLEQTLFDRDASLAQAREPTAADARVGILHGGDDTRDARPENALSARTSPADMTTGLEGHKQGAASCPLPGGVERVNLGMRFAGALVPAVADDHTVGRNDDGAHHGIRRGAPGPARRVKECAPHHRAVEGAPYHFSWNSAST